MTSPPRITMAQWTLLQSEKKTASARSDTTGGTSGGADSGSSGRGADPATKKRNPRKGLSFQEEVIDQTQRRYPNILVNYAGIPMIYAGQCPANPKRPHWTFHKKGHVDLIATSSRWSAHLEAKITESDAWCWDRRLLDHQSDLLAHIIACGMFAAVILRHETTRRTFLIPWDTRPPVHLDGETMDSLVERGYEIPTADAWVEVAARWYDARTQPHTEEP